MPKIIKKMAEGSESKPYYPVEKFAGVDSAYWILHNIDLLKNLHDEIENITISKMEDVEKLRAILKKYVDDNPDKERMRGWH